MAARVLRYYMSLQPDLSVFQQIGIILPQNSAVLGVGRQGFVIEDKGTAIKFYAANQGLPEALSIRRAQAEANTLAWLAHHNDTGIKTPQLHDFMVFPQPVDMHTPTGDFTFLAAMRMEQLQITPPSFGPDWLEKCPQEGARFFRSLGRTIAAFNNLAERVQSSDPLSAGDDLPEALRFGLGRQSAYIKQDDLRLMLADHARLTAGKPASLKHGDLHPGNVSYNRHSQEVDAVFDWASIVKAPAGRDLHHFATLSPLAATQARNDLVQEGYYSVIATPPDPVLTRLYGVMQLARMIIRTETLGELMNESFSQHVLEPYQHSLASYRQLRVRQPSAPSGPAAP